MTDAGSDMLRLWCSGSPGVCGLAAGAGLPLLGADFENQSLAAADLRFKVI
jgi:hypothetical protein